MRREDFEIADYDADNTLLLRLIASHGAAARNDSAAVDLSDGADSRVHPFKCIGAPVVAGGTKAFFNLKG